MQTLGGETLARQEGEELGMEVKKAPELAQKEGLCTNHTRPSLPFSPSLLPILTPPSPSTSPGPKASPAPNTPLSQPRAPPPILLRTPWIYTTKMTDHSLPWKLKRCQPSAQRDGVGGARSRELWAARFGGLGREGGREARPPSLPPTSGPQRR